MGCRDQFSRSQGAGGPAISGDGPDRDFDLESGLVPNKMERIMNSGRAGFRFRSIVAIILPMAMAIGSARSQTAPDAPVETPAAAADDGDPDATNPGEAAEIRASAEEEPFTDAETEIGEMIQAGRFSAALEKIRALTAGSPNDVFLLRLEGYCLFMLDRNVEAVRVLRRCVALAPDDAASRFYLAQALAYAGSIEESLDQLETVTETAPNSIYAASAEEHRPELEALEEVVEPVVISRERRWDLTLATAAKYDDNVPSRSDAVKVPGGTDSFVFTFAGEGEYRPLDQYLDDSPATLGINAGFYQSLHERSPLTAYDLFNLDLGATVSRTGSFLERPLEIAVKGTWNRAWLEQTGYSRSHGAGLAADWQIADNLVLQAHYQWSYVDFDEDTAFPRFYSRDAHEHSAGAGAYAYWLENKVITGANYSYQRDFAEGTQFGRDAHQAGGFVRCSLPWETSLTVYASYATEGYVNFIPLPERQDDPWTLTVSLGRQLWIDGLTANLSYTWFRADSNIPFATFERNLFGLGLTCEF